jgi:hypothetical protein
MAILTVLFLVGGIAGANQMLKALERRQSAMRDADGKDRPPSR